MESSELQTAPPEHKPVVNQKAVLAPDHANDQSAAPLDRFFGGASGDAPNGGVAGLLGSPSLSHSANGSVRAVAFKRAQQTYGNRFAQRASPGRFIERHCSCRGTCEKCRAEEEPLSPSPAETQPQLQPALPKLSSMNSQYFIGKASVALPGSGNRGANQLLSGTCP